MKHKKVDKKQEFFQFNILVLCFMLTMLGLVILGLSFATYRGRLIAICAIGIFLYAIRMFFWSEDKKIEKMQKLKKTNISLDKKQRNAIWVAITMFAFVSISCIIGAILNIKDVLSFVICILVALSCLFIATFLYFILIKKE